MSLQDLSLPVDIPWRLIATSPDMIATHANPFPNAMWRSSLAIFAYDPDLSDLPEVFADRELSFLKVAASITSYAPPPPPMKPPNPKDYGEFQTGYDAAVAKYKEHLSLYQATYPCSGALLQVAVYPRAAEGAPSPSGDPAALAYLTSIEPQKRELIEVVTESGEAMTSSRSDLNVKKGVTTLDSTENSSSVSVGAKVQGSYGPEAMRTAGEASVGATWGTVKKTSTETSDVTTTDASRERRESSSHTTNLSQLYHLLNSYHLGTNRAIFFLQSRPHTVQQKDRFTFIQGPQEIEGIQEFFLVVSRPKGVSLKDFCVDALLYTAHLDIYSVRALLLDPKTAETPWIDLWATSRITGNNIGRFRGAASTVGMPAPGVDDPVHMSNIVSQGTGTWSLWTQLFNQSYAVSNPAGTIVDFLHDGPDLGRNDATEPAAPLGDTYHWNPPAVLDQTITTGVLGAPVAASAPHFDAVSLGQWVVPPIALYAFAPKPIPGWRIDRSRGLGGYDLWEDPYNSSASGVDPDKLSFKPQAFIDILSSGPLTDPTAYLPDCALRIRAIAWALGSDREASYHARLKVYFVRDGSTDDRSIPMFVTARGISTCTDSPVANLYSDPSALAHESSVHAVTAAASGLVPSRDRSPSVRTGASSAGGTHSSSDAAPSGPNAPLPGTPNPLADSAPPGAVDMILASTARAGIANSLADGVRTALKSRLSSPPQPTISFAHSDLFFQRMARATLAYELSSLIGSAVGGSHLDLAAFVLAHPTAATLGADLGALQIAVQAQQQPPPTAPSQGEPPPGEGNGPPDDRDTAEDEDETRAAQAKDEAPKRVQGPPKQLQPLSAYPGVTLGTAELSQADRNRLVSAGITSGLDLLSLSAAELADRLEIDDTTARSIRLAAIGISLPKPSAGQ